MSLDLSQFLKLANRRIVNRQTSRFRWIRVMGYSKRPFSETDRTDQPASSYTVTKKSGEEIAHVYIFSLSITGISFFTVYGPWGRPDMVYFSFTKDILEGNPIMINEGGDQKTVTRDFTYIDDIVKACLAELVTAEKCTKQNGRAQLRVFNLRECGSGYRQEA